MSVLRPWVFHVLSVLIRKSWTFLFFRNILSYDIRFSKKKNYLIFIILSILQILSFFKSLVNRVSKEEVYSFEVKCSKPVIRFQCANLSLRRDLRSGGPESSDETQIRVEEAVMTSTWDSGRSFTNVEIWSLGHSFLLRSWLYQYQTSPLFSLCIIFTWNILRIIQPSFGRQKVQITSPLILNTTLLRTRSFSFKD